MNKVLEIATSQIGQDEKPHGSNWGEPVKSYLKSVQINFPASWCMAFVYWCVEQAKIRVPDGTGGLRNPLVMTGGVLEQWNHIDKKYKKAQPEVGSIFIMDFGKGLGHTGFVEKFDDKYIYTIEGNTNDTGSREGIKVCRKKRLRSSIKGYINYQ